MDWEKVKILQTAVYKQAPLAGPAGIKDASLLPAVTSLLTEWLKEKGMKGGTLSIRGLRIRGTQVVAGTRVRRLARAAFVSISVTLKDTRFTVSQKPSIKEDTMLSTLEYKGDEQYRDLATQFLDVVIEIFDATRMRS